VDGDNIVGAHGGQQGVGARVHASRKVSEGMPENDRFYGHYMMMHQTVAPIGCLGSSLFQQSFEW